MNHMYLVPKGYAYKARGHRSTRLGESLIIVLLSLVQNLPRPHTKKLQSVKQRPRTTMKDVKADKVEEFVILHCIIWLLNHYDRILYASY